MNTHKHPNGGGTVADTVDNYKAAEATAREAQAACAAMRAAIEGLLGELEGLEVRGLPCIPSLGAVDHCRLALLSTTIGAGWVSPEEHAAVVRERDEAREEKKAAREQMLQAFQQYGESEQVRRIMTNCATERGKEVDTLRDAAAAKDGEVAQLKAELEEVRGLLAGAVDAIDGLEGQQASPDDSFKPASDAARAYLDRTKKEGT